MSNDKTKWIFDDAPQPRRDERPGGEMTETLGEHGRFTERTHAGSNDPTVLHGPSEEKTQIYSRVRAGERGAAADEGAEIDPVVGWLVIVRGPGTGYSVPLGAGMNTIGRGDGARAPLPFGDTLISSEDHARIIYDDSSRSFFIAHGSGKNISRVDGQLLANTLPLEDNALIELSRETHLRFRQFCSAEFDWSDLDESAKTE